MRRHTYLVATDLSQASRRGARAAARLAERADGEMDLFCAVPPEVSEDMEQFVTKVKEHLGSMAQTLAKRGLEVGTHVAVAADPVTAILQRGKRVEAATIVVAPQGATGLRKFMLGSTTERLLRRAPASLLIARPFRPEGRPCVLIATDRSSGGKRALRLGLEYCSTLEADVIVLEVIRPPGALIFVEEALESANSYRREQARRRKEHTSFAEFVAKFPHHGLDVKTDVREGNAAAEIVAEARARKADLVIIGTQGKTRTQEFFLGSVSHAVALHAPCSVLLIRARPPRRANKDKDKDQDAGAKKAKRGRARAKKVVKP